MSQPECVDMGMISCAITVCSKKKKKKKKKKIQSVVGSKYDVFHT